jgi:hypothetical protein
VGEELVVRKFFSSVVTIIIAFFITYTINLYFIFTHQDISGTIIPLYITIIAFVLALIIKRLGGK